MELEFDEQREMIRDSIRDVLRTEDSTELVRERRGEPTTRCPAFWDVMAQLGWLALAVDSSYGGEGISLLDLGVLYEETGRHLVPTTLYSTIYAALILDEMASVDQKHRLLPDLAEGSMVCTVATVEPRAIHDAAYFRTRAERRGDGWVLNGTKLLVPHAGSADLVVLFARTGPRSAGTDVGAFLLDPERDGVSLHAHETFSRDAAHRVELEDVRVSNDRVLGGPEHAGDAWDRLPGPWRRAAVLQCMEMVGGAQRVLDETVDHVTDRVQFDRPIGSFQAVQHHCAEMARLVDGARLTTYRALWALHQGAKGAGRALAIAQAWTSEAYKTLTIRAHDLHGGKGYIKSHDLFLFSERAKVTESLFGTRHHHLRRLADRLGFHGGASVAPRAGP